MTDDRPSGLVRRRDRLDPVPESARAARDLVLEILSGIGRDDLVDAATLLVSELVTNAIVHARTPIDLEITAGAGGLRVAVHDHSATLPTQRHYGRGATTGRGLALLELIADRHGADSDATDGKTVWFELGSVLDRPGAPVATATPEADPQDLLVSLREVPVPLALAWQQHADTLLREYLLSRWDDAAPPAPADEGHAHDAFATIASALAPLAAGDALPARADVTLRVSQRCVPYFHDLDVVLEHVLRLAEQGLTLAPTTQPEARELRRWVVTQVVTQAAGGAPGPWPGLSSELEPAKVPMVDWDSSAVRSAVEAVVAADDLNRILAASPAALELLGWDADLIGRRIVTIIPERFRESHIAAFTLNLLTGDGRIIGREVTVPALRRDGTELEITLLVARETVADGRAVFTATMHRA